MPGDYTTSSRVTVRFTVPDGLIDLGPVPVLPIRFVISDGRQLFTAKGDFLYVQFDIATEASGNFVDWKIEVSEK